jgi:hypothetical protein
MDFKLQDFEAVQEHRAASYVQSQLQQLNCSLQSALSKRSVERLTGQSVKNSRTSIGSPTHWTVQPTYQDYYRDPLAQLAAAPKLIHCKVTDLILQDKPRLNDLKKNLGSEAQIGISRLLRAEWGHLSKVLTQKVLQRGCSEVGVKTLEKNRTLSLNPPSKLTKRIELLQGSSVQLGNHSGCRQPDRYEVKPTGLTWVSRPLHATGSAKMFTAVRRLDGTSADPNINLQERSESPPSFMLCSYEGGKTTRPVTDRRAKAITRRLTIVARRNAGRKPLPPLHTATPDVNLSFIKKATVSRTPSTFIKPGPTKTVIKRKQPARYAKLSSNGTSPPKWESSGRLRLPPSKSSVVLVKFLKES